MLKIFIVLLLCMAILQTRASSSVFSDDCTGCKNLPCQLPHDPTCSLKTYYKPGAETVQFQISMKTLSNEWIGIVLNKAELPGMVGSNVIMLHFSSEFKIYNGYLKYYNSPVVEDSQLTDVEFKNNGDVTTVTFSRAIHVKSVHKENTWFDLTQCNFVAVARGELDGEIVRQHLDTPLFSENCYKLAELPSLIPPNNFQPKDTIELSDKLEEQSPEKIKIVKYGMVVETSSTESTTISSTTTTTIERTSSTTETPTTTTKTTTTEASTTTTTATTTTTTETTTTTTTASTTIETTTTTTTSTTTTTTASTTTETTTTTTTTTSTTSTTTSTTTTITQTTTTTTTTPTTTTTTSTTTTASTTTETSTTSTITSTTSETTTTTTTTETTTKTSEATTTYATFTTTTTTTTTSSTTDSYLSSTTLTSIYIPTTSLAYPDKTQTTTYSSSTYTSSHLENFYYLIDITVNEPFSEDYADPESPSHKLLEIQLSDFMKRSLEHKHMNGFKSSSLINVVAKAGKHYASVNQIVTTSQLIYQDEANKDHTKLQADILHALKSSNLTNLNVVLASVAIRQQETMNKTKSVPLEQILLPSILGSIGLVLFIVAILLGYFCYKRNKSYNLYDYPKMEFVNMIRI